MPPFTRCGVNGWFVQSAGHCTVQPERLGVMFHVKQPRDPRKSASL